MNPWAARNKPKLVLVGLRARCRRIIARSGDWDYPTVISKIHVIHRWMMDAEKEC
jgi:hypothetical protein